MEIYNNIYYDDSRNKLHQRTLIIQTLCTQS
jgi:hypothetical protein